jgi:hypothetical protein
MPARSAGRQLARQRDSQRAAQAGRKGTNQETNEGARGGSAVREENCQAVDSSGGAAAKRPRAGWGGRTGSQSTATARGSSAKTESGTTGGRAGTSTEAFSTEQQPVSAQWAGLAGEVWREAAQPRKPRPGTFSRRQWDVRGAQASANSRASIAFIDRTPNR